MNEQVGVVYLMPHQDYMTRPHQFVCQIPIVKKHKRVFRGIIRSKYLAYIAFYACFA